MNINEINKSIVFADCFFITPESHTGKTRFFCVTLREFLYSVACIHFLVPTAVAIRI